jgi:Flp pilus assembly protein TadD
MIIVEPPATRYESADSGATNEEHLLERISSLENNQARLTDKLERGLDLLLRQAQNAHFDRAMVKSLVDLLTDDGLVQGVRLERLWLNRCQKDAEEQQESERREELRLRILSYYRGQERVAFEQRINEGFLFIDDGQLVRGIRSLRRAAEMAPENAPLLSFVGEHFFRTGKTERARGYLARAYEIAPGDMRISLLLGLTCGDEGDSEQAKELLSSATRRGRSSFAAHYGLGRLFVAEENWRKALHEFKLALASRVSPEAHYALGCLYYQLGRDPMASRHLRKALEMDEAYGEALYVLGLISERAGRRELASEYFARAGSGRAIGSTVSTNGKRHSNRQLIAPLFRVSSSRPHRLITGGDRRLAEALKEDALRSHPYSDLDIR